MEPTPKPIDVEFLPEKGPDQEFWEQVFTIALSMIYRFHRNPIVMEVAADPARRRDLEARARRTAGHAHDCAALADACLTEWRKRWQKSAYEKQQAMPSTEPEGDITA